MSMDEEWRALRLGLMEYVRQGGTLSAIGRSAGVTPQTLVNWLDEPQPPETVRKAAAVMKALREARHAGA